MDIVGQTTDKRHRMAAILENKNYGHFTPITGQGSALIRKLFKKARLGVIDCL
jgi:hypothetical protein